MAFFPLASIQNTKGYTRVHNFSPNQWELTDAIKKTLWAIYSNGEHWETKELATLEVGESQTYYYDEILPLKERVRQPLILLQFRRTPLASKLETLPAHEFSYSKLPEWRATVGFQLNKAQTSYQGEINPFPNKASLLTFHPFIQYDRTHNYLVVFNAEKSPVAREANLEIYNSASKELIDKVVLHNNCVNVIALDQYTFTPQELPVFVSRNMAGIPFGFGISHANDMLSLEHTHPPASFVVHGERFKVQGEIKKRWFDVLKEFKT